MMRLLLNTFLERLHMSKIEIVPSNVIRHVIDHPKKWTANYSFHMDNILCKTLKYHVALASLGETKFIIHVVSSNKKYKGGIEVLLDYEFQMKSYSPEEVIKIMTNKLANLCVVDYIKNKSLDLLSGWVGGEIEKVDGKVLTWYLSIKSIKDGDTTHSGGLFIPNYTLGSDKAYECEATISESKFSSGFTRDIRTTYGMMGLTPLHTSVNAITFALVSLAGQEYIAE